MSSKINTGIFVIATLTLMVAGTLYGGMTNAFAQQSNNVGNFASVSQSNSAVGVASANADATGGNGGTGAAGGAATATGGTAVVGISQSNDNTITQSIDRSTLIGSNVDKSNCKCDGKPQTNNVGNFATVSQSNDAIGIATADASATGGNGGPGTPATATTAATPGGAGGAATATGGFASVGIGQSNTNSVTQSIADSFLGGFNFR
jgi:hypothetical protein